MGEGADKKASGVVGPGLLMRQRRRSATMARTRTTDQVSTLLLAAKGTSWRDLEQYVLFSR